MEGAVTSLGLPALPRLVGRGFPSQGPAGKGMSEGQARRKRIRTALRKAGISKGARCQGGGLR